MNSDTVPIQATAQQDRTGARWLTGFGPGHGEWCVPYHVDGTESSHELCKGRELARTVSRADRQVSG